MMFELDMVKKATVDKKQRNLMRWQAKHLYRVHYNINQLGAMSPKINLSMFIYTYQTGIKIPVEFLSASYFFKFIQIISFN